MVLNTETHSWAPDRVWDFRALTPNEASSSSQAPPLRAQRATQKRESRDCKSQRWRMTPKEAMLSRPSRTDAHRNYQSLWQHTQDPHGLRPGKIPQQGRWIKSPTPNQGNICNWYLLEKGKISLSNSVSLATSDILQRRLCAQGSLANTIRPMCPWFLICLVWFGTFYLTIFSICFFLLISI